MPLPPGPLKLASLRAEFHSLALPMGLVLDTVQLFGGPAVLNPQPFSLKLDRPAELEATISPASLQAFLKHSLPATLRDPVVTCEEGAVRVVASVRVLVADVRTGVRVTLQIEHETRLNIVLLDTDVPAARGLIERQLQEQNPILDTATLPVRFRLREVTITSAGIGLSGWLEP